MPLAPLLVQLIRPDDLLSLTFKFDNLNLDTQSSPPVLKRAVPNKPAFIIVEFPPQHITEEAIFQSDNLFEIDKAYIPDNVKEAFPGGYPDSSNENQEPVKMPLKSLLSDKTRLVFKVPNDPPAIPFTSHSLLDWSKYELNLVPVALPLPQIKRGNVIIEPDRLHVSSDEVVIITEERQANTRRVFRKEQFPNPMTDRYEKIPVTPIITKFQDLHTIIEAPYRLMLSPNRYARWAHSVTAVSRKSSTAHKPVWTELWHTRLGVKKTDGVEEINDYNRTLRAVWTENYDRSAVLPPHDNIPFRTSLSRRDKWELVRLTADSKEWQYRIIRAHRLMLSSLGAWMNLRYAADVPPGSGFTVEEWRHIAAMGKDQYVRLVYKGFLLPFGHAASLIKITERKFENIGGNMVAALYQRMYIVVRQPEVIYRTEYQKYKGKSNPFESVRLTTLVTSDLNDPTSAEGRFFLDQPSGSMSAFWPMVGEGTNKNDFLFHAVAIDRYGQRCEFALPLAFVDNGIVSGQGSNGGLNLIAHYNDSKRRICNIFGQKIALAESTTSASSDTTLNVRTLTFELLEPDDEENPNLALKCFPAISEASVHIPGMKDIAMEEKPVVLQFYQPYLEDGFSGNNKEVEVFAAFPEALQKLPAQLRFGADKCGGIAIPNLNLVGLSRKFGPLGGNDVNSLDKLSGSNGSVQFDPIDFFGKMDAKILGGIGLGEIVDANGNFNENNVPRLMSRPIYEGNIRTDSPDSIETTLYWNPKIQNSNNGVFNPDNSGSLLIDAKIWTTKNDSTFTVHGQLNKFNVNLFEFIKIHFDKFTFDSIKGQKLAVDPVIDAVEFGGPLEFVNELREYLRTDGLNTDVTPSGVYAGLTVTIPTIGLGVMTVQNIALGASINLPFAAEPIRFRFAFSKREHPFILTVYGLGGGGFFGLELGVDGVELLEAALEFGASIALDIGVASGEVHIMAGIYYRWESEVALLEGYLRLGGELEILGIVSLSVEFYMALAYASEGNKSKVWGEARLTVEVEVGPFSKSVTMTVRREFSDPDRITFQQYMTEQDWKEIYCEAFA